MSFANPVSGGTPSYDGFWTLVEPTIDFSSTLTTSSLTFTHDPTAVAYPYDLTPASEYDTTVDSGCTGDASQWAYDTSLATQKCLT